MSIDRPLFQSAHQALLFAYTYVPNSHAQAAAAERLLSAFGRQRYADDEWTDAVAVVREARGLIGLDGAAQAGMIKSAVCRLKPVAQLAIPARFDVLRPAEQKRAMRAGIEQLADGFRSGGIVDAA